MRQNLDLKTLQQSTEASLLYLKKLSPKQKFQYGKLEYSVAEVILSMELLQKIKTSDSKKTFINQLKKNFFGGNLPAESKITKFFSQATLNPNTLLLLSLLKNIQYLLMQFLKI